jgi:hypothetical protein
MPLTDNPNDPCIKRYTGVEEPAPQHDTYLVLSREERAKGFVRPLRQQYIHMRCKGLTHMGLELSETYARDPKFYGATYCCTCLAHFPVGEFTWANTTDIVGS